MQYNCETWEPEMRRQGWDPEKENVASRMSHRDQLGPQIARYKQT